MDRRAGQRRKQELLQRRNALLAHEGIAVGGEEEVKAVQKKLDEIELALRLIDLDKKESHQHGDRRG